MKDSGGSTASELVEGSAGEADAERRSAVKSSYPHAGEPYDRLTGREKYVVAQLVKHRGAPNKVVAYALQISPNTLRNHLASIYAKLGVRRRVELVLYAMERGLDDTRGR